VVSAAKSNADERLQNQGSGSRRASRIKAIKAAMNGIGKSNENYYPELSDRLNMKRPFTSLTRLTKTDLDRVYQMVLRDSRR
jgi:hypothetical protein